MFHKMPFILFGVIASAILFNSWIPAEVQSVFFALGLSIKSAIMFLLPFVIFSLLFKTAAHLAKSATKIILFLLAAVCCSNFISTMVSYNIGTWIHHFNLSLEIPKGLHELKAAWNLTLPQWISNAHAMFGGLASGILLSLIKPKLADKVAAWLDRMTGVILKGFILAMPCFIAGFAMKLAHDGMIQKIISDYAVIFVVIVLALLAYISFLYFLANRFRAGLFWKSVRNMLPAAAAGFGSMSSAAAMPLTIIGAEKNSNLPDVARAVIPATVNIHLIGDCFAIPIFAFAVLQNFGMGQPELFAYMTFAFYFVMAKFSVAAIPGGGIIVMLPILESYLGFNAEMMSLITALYILFDPLITCANVLGNGAFSMLFSRLFGNSRKRTEEIVKK